MSEIKVNKVSSRTGSAVTLGTSGDTFTIPSGVTITNSGTSNGFGAIAWQSVVTSNTTMVAGRGYFVNTTSGAITMTLPSSATAGDQVAIKDYTGTFNTNNLTIARNGHKIQGKSANSLLNTIRASVLLTYVDATEGWVFTQESNVADLEEALYISATGGTESTSGDYKIHTFNSSSNFVVASLGNAAGAGSWASKVDYMVVAGGGSGHGKTTPGNYENGGGGGAGGFREGRVSSPAYTASPLVAPDGLTVAAQTYPITVGAGGAGGPLDGGGGNASVFSTISSAGGGRAGGGGTNTGAAGGSGGGGTGWAGGPGNAGGAGNTPPVSPPQGNAGGTGSGCGNNASGAAGGGGATTVGGNGSGTTGGNGGEGATTHISGSPVARAGGGAGSGGTGGTGHSGGGNGGGGPNDNGTAASANTGSGGGGSGPGIGTGKNGGSGVVIVRYKYQN